MDHDPRTLTLRQVRAVFYRDPIGRVIIVIVAEREDMREESREREREKYEEKRERRKDERKRRKRGERERPRGSRVKVQMASVCACKARAC